MTPDLLLGPHRVRILAEQPEYGFAEGHFAPGVPGPPLHSHDWDEGFYVVSGSLAVEVDGERLLLGPGEFALAPGGSSHTFAVEGDCPAVFFATFGSGRGISYLREMAAVFAADGRPDAERLRVLHASYGVTTADG